MIADYVVTQEMLKYFITKSCGRFSLVKPEVMICIPAGVTGVETRAVRDAASRPARAAPISSRNHWRRQLARASRSRTHPATW